MAKRKHPGRRSANPVRIRPTELRIAREMLGWSCAQLARLAAVSHSDLAAFERLGGNIDRGGLRRLQLVLESGGIDFVGPPTFPGLVAYRPDRAGAVVALAASRKLRGDRR